MAVLSASTPERFTPSGYDNHEVKPVYLIKPATVRERNEYQVELVRHGIAMPSNADILAAVRQGVVDVSDEQDHPVLFEILDRLQGGLTIEPDEAKSMTSCSAPCATAIIALLQNLKRIGQMVYRSPQPCGAGYALSGGKISKKPFEVKNGRVTQATLDSIPTKDLEQIGIMAIALMFMNKDAEKNSVSPSQSSANP